MWSVRVIISTVGRPEIDLSFSHSPVTIGGTPDNDVVLTGVGVSDSHAMVIVSHDSLVYCDRSGAGSFCNGERIDRRVLQRDDIVEVPPFRLRFEFVRDQDAVDTLRRIQGEETRPLAHTMPGVLPTTAAAPSFDTTVMVPIPHPPPRGRTEPVAAAPALQVAAETEEMALLVMEGPPSFVGCVYPLTAERHVIGRSEPADVLLVSPTVSRRHAEITRDSDGKWVLSDLNSLNGTYLKGERVTRATLHIGDEFLLGWDIMVRVVGKGDRPSKPAPPRSESSVPT